MDVGGVMGRLRITRGMALRAMARIVVVLIIVASLALALAGPGLAATEAPSTPSSGNTTLLIAALVGGAIAAVWLLRPTGRRSRPPSSGTGPDATSESVPLDSEKPES